MKPQLNSFKYKVLLSGAIVLASCQSRETNKDSGSLHSQLEGLRSKASNSEYIQSPFVSAGDKVYVVGHQDGSFPDLGWHVEGEMGGVWDHPIKLLDGFNLSLKVDDEEAFCLQNAQTFTTYPMAGKHEFLIPEHGLVIDRIQFSPDGLEALVVEYVIRNNESGNRNVELEFTAMVDLMPVWLSERLDIEDGVDQGAWDSENKVFIAKDPNNPWFVVIGSDIEVGEARIGDSPCRYERKGNGIDAVLKSELAIAGNSQALVRFVISGSFVSRDSSIETYHKVNEQANYLLSQKIERFKHLADIASVSLPDPDLQDMYEWVKYNTDWLIRDVDGIGRGVSAGIPDYPWWFGTDNGYTLEGMLAAGMHDEVLSTIKLIYDLTETVDGKGRVVHEVSTNGVVFNPGNLNTTARFIPLLWKYFTWTGDEGFLRTYYPKAEAGLEWLMAQDADENLYPDGHGIMEIHGLQSEMVDVVVYTQQAFATLAKMSEYLGDQEKRETYQRKADQLQEKINSDWWVKESGSFADFKASKEKTIELIEAAILRADTLKKPWAVEELKEVLKTVQATSSKETRGWVVHHNWIVNTPMEMGVADPAKAAIALRTAEKYTNRFGMYVTGIDRDENQEQGSKWKSFSYVGAVMTLPTGTQAIAEARYGNPDKALGYLKMLHNSFGYAFPGSLYEVSPDYGMITQAWTIYSVAVPVVEYFFGVRPAAYDREITIKPNMPESWAEQSAAIRNLPVGENKLSIERSFINGLVTYQINQTKPGWKINLMVPGPANTVRINDEQVGRPESVDGYHSITLVDTLNTVTIAY